ncbi:MAG: taurine ABC transporter substrate-binding protein [Geminicoccaceae bacterium]
MTHVTRRVLLAASAAVALIAGAGLSAEAADKPVVIGYQTSAEPSKVPQADGAYEKAIGRAIDWRKFDSGADVIAAIASGAVDIGYVGSSPLAAAASRQLPITTIFVVGEIGDAEALVVRNGSGVNAPADLAGKKVAVPFVSTTHYSLLAALEHWGIDPKSLEILNTRPPEIIAAWERGDIDAAYVWDPALGKIKESGKVLVSSAEVAKWGAPTFDAWIVRTDFAKDDPAAVRAFVKTTGDAYAAYRADPAAWNAGSAQIEKIARLSGAKPEEVPTLLAGYYLPTLQEQASPAYLGGATAKAIAATSTFLKDQGKIDAVLPDYSAYVAPQFAVEAQAAN